MQGPVTKISSTERGLIASIVIMSLVSLCLILQLEPANPVHRAGLKKLNINTADKTQLELLDGIGPATAAAIIEYRRQAKDEVVFESIEDLQNVNGIGVVKAAAMSGAICF